MPIFDGVITLDDNQIPVIIELDEQRLRMSSSGTEIGEWPLSECQIRHLADSTFAITAEDETLTFVPRQPGLFAAAVGEGPTGVALPPPEVIKESELREAPPPRPITMGLFYALCVLTAALGLWALISIIL